MDPIAITKWVQEETQGTLELEKRCQLHKTAVDPLRCDDCLRLHADAKEDLAPLGGLHQAWPIVAPLSDVRMGPQDVRQASEAQSLKRLDDQEAEWAFQREEAQESIEKERRRLVTQKQRTAKAERELNATINTCVWQVADAKKAAEDRRRRGEQDLQALEVQVRQAEILLEEAQRESARRIAEASGLVNAEQRYASDVEDLLKIAREKRLAMERHADETEARCRKTLADRDSQMEQRSTELRKNRDEAKKEAEERLAEVRRRCEERREEGRQEVLKAKENGTVRLQAEEKRNTNAKDAAERRKKDAEERLDKERIGVQTFTGVIAEDCGDFLQRKKQREEATRTRYSELNQVGAMTKVNATAESWNHMAQRKEFCTKASLDQTVYVLGHHYQTRWNYTQAADGKIKTVLKGCAQGRQA
eukprot:TRINITY_DN11471_c0_g2_i1.p1 TRINITY_DN11471_c0_g2~~TRINITY_DN11471_c0_g2_i1.p1  ORF type:complete len:419 (-),score=112.81 TRINITY_DN11471_c0_g2_i1:652-1908(-)